MDTERLSFKRYRVFSTFRLEGKGNNTNTNSNNNMNTNMSRMQYNHQI